MAPNDLDLPEIRTLMEAIVGPTANDLIRAPFATAVAQKRSSSKPSLTRSSFSTAFGGFLVGVLVTAAALSGVWLRQDNIKTLHLLTRPAFRLSPQPAVRREVIPAQASQTKTTGVNQELPRAVTLVDYRKNRLTKSVKVPSVKQQRIASRTHSPTKSDLTETRECSDASYARYTECMGYKLQAAHESLVTEYDRAITAGVARPELVKINRRWREARKLVRDDPDGALREYRSLKIYLSDFRNR
jgi:hypothetical protein